jgi:hypothetical protein
VTDLRCVVIGDKEDLEVGEEQLDFNDRRLHQVPIRTRPRWYRPLVAVLHLQQVRNQRLRPDLLNLQIVLMLATKELMVEGDLAALEVGAHLEAEAEEWLAELRCNIIMTPTQRRRLVPPRLRHSRQLQRLQQRQLVSLMQAQLLLALMLEVRQLQEVAAIITEEAVLPP